MYSSYRSALAKDEKEKEKGVRGYVAIATQSAGLQEFMVCAFSLFSAFNLYYTAYAGFAIARWKENNQAGHIMHSAAI